MARLLCLLVLAVLLCVAQQCSGRELLLAEQPGQPASFVLPLEKRRGVLRRDGQSVWRKPARAAQLAGVKASSVMRMGTAVEPGLQFTTSLWVGSPAQEIKAAVDTGSSLLHVACSGCKEGCAPNNPADSLEWKPYNPAQSSTKSALPCGSSGCDLVCSPADRADFNGCSCPAPPKKTRGLLGTATTKGKTAAKVKAKGKAATKAKPKQQVPKACNFDILYSDNTDSAGPMMADRLHAGPTSAGPLAVAPDLPVVFGCAKTSSVYNNKINAVVGLNREPGSLLSQLVAAKTVAPALSFCLNSTWSTGGSAMPDGSVLVLGAVAPINNAALDYQTARMLTVADDKWDSAADIEVSHMVLATTVTVGSKPLQWNIAMMFDTGSSYSYIPTKQYKPLVASLFAGAKAAGAKKGVVVKQAPSTWLDGWYDGQACFYAGGVTMEGLVSLFPEVTIGLAPAAQFSWAPRNYLLPDDLLSSWKPELENKQMVCLRALEDPDYPYMVAGDSLMQGKYIRIDMQTNTASYASVTSCSALQF